VFAYVAVPESSRRVPSRLLTCALGLALTLLAAAGASPALASRADHTTTVMGSFDHNGAIQVLRHPRRFKVESADSYVLFSNLHWRHWGGRVAVAGGNATTCDYTGSCSSHRTRLVANRRQRCADDYSYEQMTASEIPLYGRGPFELPVEETACALDRL
jgi:hypothetical protein